MIVTFFIPLDSLSVTNLCRFMSFNNVYDHVEKYFQKVEPIIQIDPCGCYKIKLWDYFVAIRMEHSKVVDYSLKIIKFRVFAIVL